MADNKLYISSGLIANDTGESESSNQFFISSGLIPTDKAGSGGATIPLFIHLYNQMR